MTFTFSGGALGANAGSPDAGQYATSANTSATQTNYLNGVTCVSASDCRTVGSYYNANFQQQTLVEQGVLFNGSMFICARHSDDDVDRALGAFDTAFAAMASDGELIPST